ncbi:MAG: GNAT family protein [Gemmatimonadota bacterium]
MTLPHVPLEGSLVRLEPLQEHHIPGLCAIGLDAELWRWTVTEVRTEADMRRYVEEAFAAAAAGSALPFATVHRASGRVVGSTRLAAIDLTNRRVEIGWTWLGREFQRTGMNTEAKYLMLAFAFETLGCNRVELKTDALNQKSRAAIRRIGAIEEGILRSHMISHGDRRRDTVYYSILREEWPSVREWFLERCP